jgi:hypothetical protein
VPCLLWIKFKLLLFFSSSTTNLDDVEYHANCVLLGIWQFWFTVFISAEIEIKKEKEFAGTMELQGAFD